MEKKENENAATHVKSAATSEAASAWSVYKAT